MPMQIPRSLSLIPLSNNVDDDDKIPMEMVGTIARGLFPEVNSPNSMGMPEPEEVISYRTQVFRQGNKNQELFRKADAYEGKGSVYKNQVIKQFGFLKHNKFEFREFFDGNSKIRYQDLINLFDKHKGIKIQYHFAYYIHHLQEGFPIHFMPFFEIKTESATLSSDEENFLSQYKYFAIDAWPDFESMTKTELSIIFGEDLISTAWG
eukprot:Pgem_evm1s11003